LNQFQQHIARRPGDEHDVQPLPMQPDMLLGQENLKHNLEFIDQDRDIGDFKRAAKYSIQVEYLKFILPIAGLIIIILILAALLFRPKLPVNITIGDSGIEDGKLVMNNPKLDGFDPKNRAYSVEAEKAIQSIENPTFVELIRIKAKLPMADGLSAHIEAGNGSFDVTAKKLELGGMVNVVTTNGMKLILQDAYFDLKAGTMSTHRSLNFTSESANISSQSLEIYENGDRIVFSNDVKLTLNPSAGKTN
jgi:lipopolysaccharide export system protein LptC